MCAATINTCKIFWQYYAFLFGANFFSSYLFGLYFMAIVFGRDLVWVMEKSLLRVLQSREKSLFVLGATFNLCNCEGLLFGCI